MAAGGEHRLHGRALACPPRPWPAGPGSGVWVWSPPPPPPPRPRPPRRRRRLGCRRRRRARPRRAGRRRDRCRHRVADLGLARRAGSPRRPGAAPARRRRPRRSSAGPPAGVSGSSGLRSSPCVGAGRGVRTRAAAVAAAAGATAAPLGRPCRRRRPVGSSGQRRSAADRPGGLLRRPARRRRRRVARAALGRAVAPASDAGLGCRARSGPSPVGRRGERPAREPSPRAEPAPGRPARRGGRRCRRWGSRSWVRSLLITHALPRAGSTSHRVRRGPRRGSARSGRRRPTSIGWFGGPSPRSRWDRGLGAAPRGGGCGVGWPARRSSMASWAASARIAGRASRSVSLPLRSTTIGRDSAARASRDRPRDVVGVDAGDLDLPGRAGDGLLERVGARRDADGGLRLHPRRQRRVDQRHELVGLEVVGQVDVEVLAEALVAGGQRQAEAQARARREPLAVGDADAGAAQRPLPDPGQVAVGQEADLAALGEADALLHAPTPTGRREDRATGTAEPHSRSWPVPWLPPAGGTAEATTCSMP